MAKSFTCACGASFPTPDQLAQHAASCGISREPGGEPTPEE